MNNNVLFENEFEYMSMTVSIKYFGQIAEQTGKKEEVISVEHEEFDLEALKNVCSSKYELADLDSVQIAVNQTIKRTGPLKDGDEVAFLPPFAGG